MTAEKAHLLYDYQNFHPNSRNGTKNVLYGDGHVAPLK
jgi:prepilin-type processing-associated H-X9-DG protein